MDGFSWAKVEVNYMPCTCAGVWKHWQRKCQTEWQARHLYAQCKENYNKKRALTNGTVSNPSYLWYCTHMCVYVCVLWSWGISDCPVLPCHHLVNGINRGLFNTGVVCSVKDQKNSTMTTCLPCRMFDFKSWFPPVSMFVFRTTAACTKTVSDSRWWQYRCVVWWFNQVRLHDECCVAALRRHTTPSVVLVCSIVTCTHRLLCSVTALYSRTECCAVLSQRCAVWSQLRLWARVLFVHFKIWSLTVWFVSLSLHLFLFVLKKMTVRQKC